MMMIVFVIIGETMSNKCMDWSKLLSKKQEEAYRWHVERKELTICRICHKHKLHTTGGICPECDDIVYKKENNNYTFVGC